MSPSPHSHPQLRAQHCLFPLRHSCSLRTLQVSRRWPWTRASDAQPLSSGILGLLQLRRHIFRETTLLGHLGQSGHGGLPLPPSSSQPEDSESGWVGCLWLSKSQQLNKDCSCILALSLLTGRAPSEPLRVKKILLLIKATGPDWEENPGRLTGSYSSKN